ncbi:hypothetical protein K7957_14810 [Sphingomonas yunnanensis]|uniref:hypothetical protein n=1 Tax=Sphingomonas yunnanensis TaxID=310400 RepID=UPI001CA6A4D4|nr:hypothetical protein [Sphingomonas yunnanensis]MBY9064210.1 hypothetical protein [Sphingomonas yunnanensis]
MSGVPAEHDDLRRRMARFLPLMDSTGHASGVLLRERLEFSRIFQTHSQEEQRAVAARAVAEPSFAPTAAAYREQLDGLRTDYSAHIAHWPPSAIRDDAGGYRAAVLTLQRRFHDLLAWEERHLL